MSHETPPAGRDSSGRFVKSAAEKVNAMSRTGADGVHPMSRVLFGWTEAKNAGAMIFWGVAALSVILVLLDLVIVRHEKIGIANSAGFYALWGFAAFSFVVLMGWPLGRLLRRDENYYGDLSGPPADIDPAIADRLGAGEPKAFEGDE